MSELAEVSREAARLRERGAPYLLATVVRVLGSSYRRPGARMLIAEDRWVAGSVSGGCLERDVLLRGTHRTRAGAPVVVTYDSTVEDDDVRWGLGLGCNGVVDVLLERIDAGVPLDPLRFVDECITAQTTGVLVTVIASGDARAPMGARLAVREGRVVASTLAPGAIHEDLARVALTAARANRGKSFVHESGRVAALVERIVPPLRVFVLGTRHDALPVVRIARAMGLDVTVADTAASTWTRARFRAADASVTIADAAEIGRTVDAHARAAVLLMTHDYDRDRDLLAAVLPTRALYVGVLGPRARTERMLSDLGLALTPAMRARLHAPVGLDLGAETPHEIALSMVAEMHAALAGASALPLRDRRGPIHGTVEIAAE